MHHRIELNDTMQSAIIKVADGNPGALSVLIEILKKGSQIDPDNAFWRIRKYIKLRAKQLGITGSKLLLITREQVIPLVDQVRQQLPRFGVKDEVAKV